MWPFNYNFYNLIQHTVSEKFIYIFKDTLNVSCLFCTVKVKSLLKRNNSQVTKTFNSLVGTSEAIRMLNLNTNVKFFHNKNFEYKYYQWLAGLIDGDGCFLISKKGYASL